MYVKSSLPHTPQPPISTTNPIGRSIGVELVQPGVNCSQMKASRVRFNCCKPHPGNIPLDPGTPFRHRIQMRTHKMLIGAGPSPQNVHTSPSRPRVQCVSYGSKFIPLSSFIQTTLHSFCSCMSSPPPPQPRTPCEEFTHPLGVKCLHTAL